MEDLKLEKKVEDMMAYGMDAIVQYPKSVKFTVGKHMIDLMSKMADTTIEVKKKHTKKTSLQQLDIANTQLRFFVRLSYRKKYISDGRYYEWSRMIDEIGRIVGGWINSVEKGKQ